MNFDAVGSAPHPLLSDRDIEILRAVSELRMRYINHGRGREAHGVAAAMNLVWKGMSLPDYQLDPAETRPAEL